ncbi:MAG: tetratricopeptide repeat protein [Bacteroidia bacterium]|nr:tetratricopeptide repeat protein [Bacteroidia bacterium]
MSKRKAIKKPLPKGKKPKKSKPSRSSALSPQQISRLQKTLALICAVFAVVLYANTFTHDYTVDDGTVIENNKITTKGISAIPEIFSTSYRKGFWDRKESLYRPISVAMFAIEWEIAPENPMLGHAVNILLYGLTAYFLFQFLALILGSYSLLVSLAATLLFVAHPLHTEVVANIKSRDEILGFLFSLLCLIYLVKFIKESVNKDLILSCTFLFLGLLSKESVITMFGIIPLTIYFFSNYSIKKVVQTTAVFLSVLLVYFSLRYAVLGGITENVTKQLINNSLLAAPDIMSRYATAMMIMGKYLLFFIFPHPLCFDYSYSQIPNVTFADYRAILSVIVYGALIFYVIKNFAKKDAIAYAICFYFVTVSLVSNLVVLLEATMGERFLYAPSLGFCIAVPVLLSRYIKLPKNQSFENAISVFKSGGSFIYIVLAIVALYSFKTFDRNLDWKDNLTLLEKDVQTSPNSARIRYAYGSAIVIEKALDEKDKALKNQLLDQGIVQLERGVEILNTYADAFYHLAIAYKEKNDLQNAVKNFELARQHKNWKTADFYIASGIAYGSAKIFDKAIDDLNEALKYSPNSSEAYNNLGIYYCDAGRYQESFKALNKAIELDPENAKGYYNIGNTYAKVNDFGTAIAQYQKAVSMKPDYSDAYNNIGNCYASLQDYVKAIEYYEKVIELNPNDGKVLFNIGVTYNILGNAIKAQEYFQRAKALGVG